MFIPIGDAKIFATSFGSKSAPTIMAIGGWIGSWELWLEPFSILSQYWHTIAYDHRGVGATIAPTESIMFDRLVQDVFAILDAYEVKQCILAAESAGALTAFGAALKNPQRIRGLVIVDGLYFRTTPPEKDLFLAGLRNDYSTTLHRFVEACIPEPDHEHAKRWGRQILDRASQEAAIALHLMASAVDLRNDLQHIRQPTLILHGGADVILPVQESRWLAQTLPSSKLAILEGAGHVPTMTRPSEVAHEITTFFEKDLHVRPIDS